MVAATQVAATLAKPTYVGYYLFRVQSAQADFALA